MPYIREKAKKKWTISKMKIYRDFCGWETLLELIDAIDIGLKGLSGEYLIKDEIDRLQGRALIATIFETGARISEVIGQNKPEGLIGLRTNDIRVGDVLINVILQLAKRYRKIMKVKKYRAIDGTKLRWGKIEDAIDSGHPFEEYEGFETERVIDIRNIVFPRNEPLVPYMLDWLDFCNKKRRKKLFNLSYQKAYRMVRMAGEQIGEEFTPHRLRAERATQLVLKYGFNDGELTDWFSWKSPEMAHDYTTLAPKVVEKMEVVAKRKLWER